MGLEGRVALITGGSKGIGKGCALALARDGADIAIVWRRDEAAAQQAVAEVQAMGRKCRAYQCNVTDYEKVKEVVAQVAQDFGKIDILINNAGGPSTGRYVVDTEVGEMNHQINTHIMGSFHFCKEALPHIRKNPRGDVIFISSSETKHYPAGHVPYAVGKAGMEAIARCLAFEEVGHGIRVNVIGPGMTDTDMGRRTARGVTGSDDVKALSPTWPFDRVGQPQDIGNLAAFLCSEEGGYISRQIIYVDGGGQRAL
jgi:NAD(P)-dependent dehydrogenase (short-subunit alcohol dehydrogenase family)